MGIGTDTKSNSPGHTELGPQRPTRVDVPDEVP